MRTLTSLLALPVAAAVTMGLTSCGLFSSETTTATKDLEVGQCYNTVSKESGGKNAVGEVTVVDCSKAHTYEVIAQSTFGDDIKKLPEGKALDSLGRASAWARTSPSTSESSPARPATRSSTSCPVTAPGPRVTARSAASSPRGTSHRSRARPKNSKK